MALVQVEFLPFTRETHLFSKRPPMAMIPWMVAQSVMHHSETQRNDSIPRGRYTQIMVSHVSKWAKIFCPSTACPEMPVLGILCRQAAPLQTAHPKHVLRFGWKHRPKKTQQTSGARDVDMSKSYRAPSLGPQVSVEALGQRTG